MCSKQKIRKIAWCLLLVAFISLIPTNTFRVFADEPIVPPFPYDELQAIGENDYVLFRVHGLDQIDYVECIIPNKGLHNSAYSHLLPGLSYFHPVGWTLNVNSIDYCFKNGQKVDYDLSGLDTLTTSLVSIDNEDPNHSFWFEFVYCSSDVYGYNHDEFVDFRGYGIRLFKAQNFIIEPAATPTPTPTPEQPHYFPTVTDARYTCLTYYDAVKLVMIRFYSETEQKYMIRYFTLFSERNRYSSSKLDSYPVVTSVTNDGNTARVDYYNQIVRGYSPKWIMYGDNSNGVTYFDSIEQIVSSTVSLGNHVMSVNTPTSLGNDLYYFTYTPSDDYYFEDAIFGNINSDGTVDFDGSGGGTPITPTPTTAPTPIPQPSTTPEPDDPDETSSWGWGIVNTLKYIFIPDKNKLIRLEKTTQTRFQQFGGGYDDLKHVSGFEDPVRPQNVVMKWQPFGTDSEEEQQNITLVDFEQIDFYLFQTSSGMFICECLKASFTFLMFGYLIHVIRKHFVIENTSSDESDGGGD